MNITKADCAKNQAKIAKEVRKEKHEMFNKLQSYMEDKLDKFDNKLERHEDKQEAQFKGVNDAIEKLHTKIDSFADTKVDKGMFRWIVGIIVVAMFSIGGLLLAQSIDLGVIKTILEIAEVS